MNTKDFKVIGLRIEKYNKLTCSGHNCDFNYYNEVADKHTLLLLDEDMNKFELMLHEEDGECPSGWTTASWAYLNIVPVDNFSDGYNYKPINEVILKINPDDTITDFSCELFTYSYSGYDDYYPCGYYEVNMDLFKQVRPEKDCVPVWIFIGDSCTGKSFIANHIENLIKLETDSYEELPSIIYAQVIVLGNKYNHTIDDIMLRIPENHEAHIVEFK